jgi:hypothetical protein
MTLELPPAAFDNKRKMQKVDMATVDVFKVSIDFGWIKKIPLDPPF